MGQAWQLKPVGYSSVASRRLSKNTKVIPYKNKYTRHRKGYWYAHGLSVYRMWWDFLLRAYQAEDIVVDRNYYKDWGDPDWFINTVDVWASSYGKKFFDPWWNEYGATLFAEDADKGVRVIPPGTQMIGDGSKVYLEVPTGTSAKELDKVIRRLVKENTHPTKNSHISTARFSITGRTEIRTDAYRRWLKMWDMRQKGYSIKEIHEIHGDGTEVTESSALNPTRRNMWKAKKVIKSTAIGEFPGKIV